MRRGRRTTWRQLWPWLVGSLLLHLGVLALLPGADSAARCPILLIELAQAEPKAAMSIEQPTPAAAAPEPAPVQRKQASPPPARVQQSTKLAPSKLTAVAAPVTKPVVTRGESEENVATPPPAQVVTPPSTSPTADTASVAPSNNGDNRGSSSSTGPAKDSAGSGDSAPAIDVAALKRQYGLSAVAQVQRAKFYPQSMRGHERAGSTVRVRVSFRVNRDGSLASVSASGDVAELTSAAEQAVRNAAPFGAFPAGLDASALPLGVTLEYVLK